MTRARAVLLAAAGLGLAATHAAAITKCVDAKGKVSYTDGKCPDDARSNELKLQVSPPSADPATAARAPFDPKDDDKDDPRMAAFVTTQANFEGCSNVAPDFGARNAAELEAWRARNADLLARLGRSRRYQGDLDAGRARFNEQLKAPGGAQKVAAYCDTQLIPTMKGGAR